MGFGAGVYVVRGDQRGDDVGVLIQGAGGRRTIHVVATLRGRKLLPALGFGRGVFAGC